MTAMPRQGGDTKVRSVEGRTVAVIGAGVSGLACARVLRASGAAVSVFEKARGAGGRISTRRASSLRFDHGAQYFTARAAEFRLEVQQWERSGVVAPWNAKIVALTRGAAEPVSRNEPRYVGVPGMSAITRRLAEGLPLETGYRVACLAREGDLWWLHADDGRKAGPFDAVLVSAPPEQAAALLEPAPALAFRASTVPMEPCWAVLLAFPRDTGLPFQGAFVEDSPIGWAADDSSKPGRTGGESWVLHATTQWSRSHLDHEPEAVARELFRAFQEATGADLPAPSFRQAHRWRFAKVVQPVYESCFLDEETWLGACGDWFLGPRVEDAYLSGVALAERVRAELALPRLG